MICYVIMANDDFVGHLWNLGYFALLEASEKEDTSLYWVITSDDYWMLCTSCVMCGELVEFPAAPHDCPYGNEPEGEISEVEVKQLILTDAEEVMDRLWSAGTGRVSEE